MLHPAALLSADEVDEDRSPVVPFNRDELALSGSLLLLLLVQDGWWGKATLATRFLDDVRMGHQLRVLVQLRLVDDSHRLVLLDAGAVLRAVLAAVEHARRRSLRVGGHGPRLGVARRSVLTVHALPARLLAGEAMVRRILCGYETQAISLFL